MNGPPTMKDQQQAQPLRTQAVEPRPAEADEPQSGLLAAEVRALSRLNEASSRLWHVSDLREGLQEIIAAAVALLGSDKAIAQLLGDNGRLRLVAQHGFDQAFLDFLRDVGPDDCPTCVRALQTGQRVIVEDIDVGEIYAPLRAAAKAAGYRSVQSTPILSRDGRRLGVLSTFHRVPHRPNEHVLRLLDLYVQQAADFIDRCRAEQRLRESEQRLRALSDIAPGTILWATSPGGGCSFVTRGWHDYTGQSAEQALGSGWLEPVHADNRERARRILNDAAQRREPFVLDYRLRRSDGEYRWVLAAGRPRYDDGGKFLGFVGSVIDAHERKLAENALRESEAILAGQKDAFQAAMDGRPLAACLNALVRTAVAHYGDARAAFYMLRSEGPAALQHIVGMGDDYARHVDGFKIGPESLACCLVSLKAEPVISPDVERDLRWEPWQWLARLHGYRGCWLFPIQAVGGPVLGTFALYFPKPRMPVDDDLNVASALERAAALIISQYREVAERARAEQALKEANRRKDEFLAVLGHELRNPLAPLSMATDLLQQADTSRDVLETVRPMMRRQIDHLTRLVNDLLDISRIDRGRAELQRAPLDLRRAVESAVEQCRPLMEERKHALAVELGDTPLSVDGDFQRLTQVFGNLLSNAAKYSQPGGAVTVHAEQHAGVAVVRVTDKGFGIPIERLKDVFEMFSQVPEHRSLVSGGGLGIGLALCRQLVALHGGFIEAHSDGLGCGSEFIVQLPLAAIARDEKEGPAASAAAGVQRRRILVVDDNADAAATLRMALELQGHDARAAFTGVDALETMAQFDADVVLLDLGMPQMDGFEVAGRIRAMPRGRDVLLVALTGWGQPDDRRRTAEAGFDEHLTKPIDSERLAAMLAGDMD
jgi:PAS domain S-box-containing protein